jgi:hypothetical protein
MTVLALRHGELTDYLVNPAHSTREIALRLFNRLLSVDPSLDVKLAQLLPDRGYVNHTVALEGVCARRALDILDQTSRGRRLLPILGHLPHSSDPRVAAQARCLSVKRVQSPAWAAKQMLYSDERVRANAMESIWGLDTQPAVQLLEKCVDDKNTRVVGNALLGLHITGHRDSGTNNGRRTKVPRPPAAFERQTQTFAAPYQLYQLNLSTDSADLSGGVNVKQSHAESSPSISNCLFFAVSRWLKYGGYVIVRKSHYGWWPHFLWSQDLLSFEEYSPAIPNHHLLIPPPLYRGVIKFNNPGDSALGDVGRLALALSRRREPKEHVVVGNRSKRENTGGG